MNGDMERYRSGHNEPHSKCGRPLLGAWVRIPLSPLFEKSAQLRGFLRNLSTTRFFDSVKSCTL